MNTHTPPCTLLLKLLPPLLVPRVSPCTNTTPLPCALGWCAQIFGSRVRVDSMAKVAAIEEAEKNKMRAKCEKIVAHGINCFVNRQLIYNLPEQIFAENGVMAIEHADFVGVERLAAVTGGEICSTFDHPELVTLGECDLIEEVRRGQTHTHNQTTPITTHDSTKV